MLFHKKWLYGSHVTMFQIWLMTGLLLKYAIRYFIFIYITENYFWMPGKLDNRLHVSKEDCGDIFSCHIWIQFLSWQWNIHRTTTGYNVKWSLHFYLTPGKLMLRATDVKSKVVSTQNMQETCKNLRNPAICKKSTWENIAFYISTKGLGPFTSNIQNVPNIRVKITTDYLSYITIF